MTALYELAHTYRAAADKLADLDLDDATVADTLEGMSGDLEVKAQNVVAFARNLEVLAESIKSAEASMSARRKALEKRAEGLRRYTLECMRHAGITKIECPHFAVSIRANPPAVDVFDAAQVPAQYMRQPEPPPPAPDKTLIKSVLAHGGDVPGCRLTVSQRLDVK